MMYQEPQFHERITGLAQGGGPEAVGRGAVAVSLSGGRSIGPLADEVSLAGGVLPGPWPDPLSLAGGVIVGPWPEYVPLPLLPYRCHDWGPWAARFPCPPPSEIPPPPVALDADEITTDSFRARWQAAPFATIYRLDVSEDPDFVTFVPGYEDTAVGSGTSHVVTDVDLATVYYYRVRAANHLGVSGNSNVIEIETAAEPELPAISIFSHWRGHDPDNVIQNIGGNDVVRELADPVNEKILFGPEQANGPRIEGDLNGHPIIFFAENVANTLDRNGYGYDWTNDPWAWWALASPVQTDNNARGLLSTRGTNYHTLGVWGSQVAVERSGVANLLVNEDVRGEGWQLFVVTRGPSVTRLYLGATEVGSIASGGNPGGTSSPFKIGHWFGSTQRWWGYVAEAGVCSAAISPAQIVLLKEYLELKYALDLTW